VKTSSAGARAMIIPQIPARRSAPAWIRMALLLLGICLASCGKNTVDSDTDPSQDVDPPQEIEIIGFVKHTDIEGGFWYIRGDDGHAYDPIGGLNPEYRVEDKRIWIRAVVRHDWAVLHLVGTMIEIKEYLQVLDSAMQDKRLFAIDRPPAASFARHSFPASGVAFLRLVDRSPRRNSQKKLEGRSGEAAKLRSRRHHARRMSASRFSAIGQRRASRDTSPPAL
jgi:hypothetical protein